MTNISEYINELLKWGDSSYFRPGIPHECYWISISVILLTFLLAKYNKISFKDTIRFVALVALIDYIALLFASTFVFRSESSSFDYDLTPLWSYRAILSGEIHLLIENSLNIVLFIPIGFLCRNCFPKCEWWKIICFGSFISFTIESFQLYFKRGFSELDDVLHNTLGCILGYVIASLLFNYIEKRNQ